MQTTLRIDDQLYREAKAEAARQSTTLTRFIEEGIKIRLGKRTAQIATPYRFPVYDPGQPDERGWEEIKKLSEEADLKRSLIQLGLDGEKP